MRLLLNIQAMKTAIKRIAKASEVKQVKHEVLGSLEENNTGSRDFHRVTVIGEMFLDNFV